MVPLIAAILCTITALIKNTLVVIKVFAHKGVLRVVSMRAAMLVSA